MNFARWVFYKLLQFLVLRLCTSLDTISISQPIRDGDVVVSNGETFALGFFSPGRSNHRYLGIWYNKVPDQTIVWVANRDNPINDTSGFLCIDIHGNLVVLNDENDQTDPLWSTNASASPPTNDSVAQLLDSGNLVLFQKESKKLLWQSFDYPTDTMLPYMKVGIDRRTGLNRFLTSWKSEDDPGVGNYTYKIDPSEVPQMIMYKGQVPWWRIGHWNGIRWSGVPFMQAHFLINATTFVNNNDEIATMWSTYSTSILSRQVVEESGLFKRFAWYGQERGWTEVKSAPIDQCDHYGDCSVFGLCDPYNAIEFECTCLPGFEPKFPGEWSLRDASHGCVRKPGSLICRKGEGFVKLANVKVPDTSKAQVISSLSLKACEQECLKNCNCIAYASANISEGGSGCITWHESLIDTRKFSVGGQDFYIRVDERELAQYGKKSKGLVATEGFRAIMVVSGVLILFGISFFAHWFVKRKRKGEALLYVNISEESPRKKKLGESRRQTDLPFFDMRTLITATDNFSATNKLGEGGFGSVYKGQLVNRQDIAVKRLSKHSGQGMEEFKNEVTVIAKLQHKNLVRLLGCCIHKEEKMLIYEYLPNKSLDYFIYDETRRSHLDWRKRIKIVNGIARGILYLHHDSRLKIIHRDLKASNILLDGAMNPKISDFGIAKMFGEDQSKGNTKRVVGTYGYMSPEYAMHGVYSTKSDVFSFGVLLLEIISGRKNTDFIGGSSTPNLIGHVWELWKEGRILDIIDPTLCQPYSAEEVVRCIHIGLLCVQEATADRPTMSSVVFMLANGTTLPPPITPGFIFQDKCSNADSSRSRSGGGVSLNRITITTLEAR